MKEAKKTGRPVEIEVFAYNAKQDFEQASVGIVESRGRHGRTRHPVSDGTYLIPKGEGEFFFGNGEGDDEVVPVAKSDVALITKKGHRLRPPGEDTALSRTHARLRTGLRRSPGRPVRLRTVATEYADVAQDRSAELRAVSRLT